MRRRDKVASTISILVIIWMLSRYSIDDDFIWALIPLGALVLFGLYSLITIIYAVISLKDFP